MEDIIENCNQNIKNSLTLNKFMDGLKTKGERKLSICANATFHLMNFPVEKLINYKELGKRDAEDANVVNAQARPPSENRSNKSGKEERERNE